MSQRLFKLRGVREEIRQRGANGPQALFRLTPGTARDGAGDTVEVSGDTVVRVELDNGFVLWSRMDDLSRDFGTPPARDGDGSWEISRLAPRRAAASERGLAGLAVRILDFFGIDLAEKSAAALGEHFEEKLIGKHPPGFYRLELAGEFALKPVADDEAIPADAGPLLLFLHGTASSAEGSFGKLWDGGNLEGARLRQSLLPTYGDRVFALEHHTLTESPINNALALAKRLPAGADIHLVSHSRGGLVGDAGAPAYVAAKHGVTGLTRSAALAYASQGVRINSIHPGYVETAILANLDGATRQALVAKHAIGRLGRAEEIAHAVAFLLSDGASFLAGSALVADGGYTAA